MHHIREVLHFANKIIIIYRSVGTADSLVLRRESDKIHMKTYRLPPTTHLSSESILWTEKALNKRCSLAHSMCGDCAITITHAQHVLVYYSCIKILIWEMALWKWGNHNFGNVSLEIAGNINLEFARLWVLGHWEDWNMPQNCTFIFNCS